MAVIAQEPSSAPLARDELGLAEAHRTLTRVLDAIEEYVYVGEFLPDDGYRLVFAGPCRERFLGMSAEAAQGAVWVDYVHPRDIEIFDGAHAAAQTTGRLDVEYRLVGADGVVRWVRDRGHLRDEDGRRLLDGSILDTTEINHARIALEAAHADAQRIAQLDPLTGAFNRRAMSEQLNRLAGRPVAVLSIDIDYFKNLNDLYGHAIGDAALVAVADSLRRATDPGAPIFRTGGEEFLIVVPEVTDDVALSAVAEAVRERVQAAEVLAAGEPIGLTVSIGAARADGSTGAGAALLLAADRALYAAKRSGRNQVHLASTALESGPEIEHDGGMMRLANAMLDVAAACGGIDRAQAGEVSTLAAQIAHRIEASEPLTLRCRIAGLLHDIGTARLPEAVRSSPPDERDASGVALMRSHPALAAALVGAVPDLQSLAPILRQHRERYDGTGYPDGLVGEQIRLDAQIVGAAVAWVLTSGAGRALAGVGCEAMLQRMAGSHSAPVMAALRSVLEDLD